MRRLSRHRYGYGGHYGSDPGKKKGKKRKASPYNKFVSFHMKKGLTMKQVARLWKSKKTGHAASAHHPKKKGHKGSKKRSFYKGLTKPQRRKLQVDRRKGERLIMAEQRKVAVAWKKENRARAAGDRKKLREAKAEKRAANKKVVALKHELHQIDPTWNEYEPGGGGFHSIAHAHAQREESLRATYGDPDGRKLPKHAYAKWLHKNAGKFKTKRERKAAWKKHKHALLRTSKARKGSRKAHKKAHKGKKKGSRKVKRHRSIRGYTTRGLSRAEQRHMHRQYRLATRRKGGKGRKGGRKGRRSPR
jgi:hypothetical protein